MSTLIPFPAKHPQPVARCPQCGNPIHYNRTRSTLLCAAGLSCGWVKRIAQK